ncbi:MAG: DMT family transporter [Saprospiraceae bacterium]|nr:DMT family transporter [Saprospiraceae bacterium]
MFLLLICILFNAYISIVFKIFERYKVRTLQAIVLNYFVCPLTASVLLGRAAVSPEVLHKEWIWAAIGIGFTFIVTFILFAQTVQKFGVVLGSIFQKMSLVAPTILAISFYNESASWIKIVGIILAIASIFVISFNKTNGGSESSKKIDIWLWMIPLGTFLGSCVIDSGLFLVNQTGLASSLDIDFVATLFFFAGVFGIAFVLYDYFMNGVTYRKKEIIAGFALGIPNFFSIYFLMMVLSNGMDGSIVFPINNVGILLTTAVLGLLFFGEKFNTRKLIGFTMAVVAIILVANG